MWGGGEQAEKQLGGGVVRLVAAGACADRQGRVSLFERVARHQRRHQRGVEFGQARVDGGEFLVGQFAQFGIGLHRLRGGEVVACLALVGERGGDRFEDRKSTRLNSSH